MRESLIQYLNNQSDGNLLAQFIHDWVKSKCPDRSSNDIVDFVNLFVHGLISTPSLFDSRYQDALSSLLTQAQIELKVNYLQNKQGNIIKYL